MKFRLATAEELTNRQDQVTNEPAEVCADPPAARADLQAVRGQAADENTVWDTIPMPPSKRVYVIMSFVAEEQVGRYVFHCHILKHEDTGLMAPFEVWKPTPATQ
jgi:FtsP/CotA-like multicopper oxidase with cupredoxin domain